MDISSMDNKSFGKKRFWLLVVDDATDYCWSFFLKEKSKTGKVLTDLIKRLKDNKNVTVKKICCDNAGENTAFKVEAERQRLGLQFKYTARKTPQQNGRVERKSATLFERVHAMLNTAGYVGEKMNLRHGLWAEAVAVATKVENILVSANKPVPAYNSFFGKQAPYAKHLRTFGECGVVHDGKKIQSKLENCGEKYFCWLCRKSCSMECLTYKHVMCE